MLRASDTDKKSCFKWDSQAFDLKESYDFFPFSTSLGHNVAVFAWKRSTKLQSKKFTPKGVVRSNCFWTPSNGSTGVLNFLPGTYLYPTQTQQYKGRFKTWLSCIAQYCHHVQETPFHNFNILIHMQMITFANITDLFTDKSYLLVHKSNLFMNQTTLVVLFLSMFWFIKKNQLIKVICSRISRGG